MAKDIYGSIARELYTSAISAKEKDLKGVKMIELVSINKLWLIPILFWLAIPVMFLLTMFILIGR
jgi:hypothetical protein